MDALGRTPLGNANAQILWVVLRKTYGWNKKADSISITQFMHITGLSRRTVVYALQNLEAKNMITVQRNKTEQSYNDVNLIGFQKDYDKWVVQGIAQNYNKTLQKQRDNYKRGVVQGKEGSARIGKKVVQGLVSDEPFLAPTIDTITKESITKERILVHFQEFYNAYPKHKAKQDALKAWTALAPNEALLSTILDALKKHKTCDEWTKEDGKYIPYPATWIRKRRWEDEISETKTGGLYGKSSASGGIKAPAGKYDNTAVRFSEDKNSDKNGEVKKSE